MFISYAQNFEDVILNRVLSDIDGGFYIDVGASDPVDDSVTKAFYDRGWSGISIEPVFRFYQELCKQRTRDINLSCVIGQHSDLVAFHDVTSVRGWGSSSADLAEHYRRKGLEVCTNEIASFALSDICEKFVGDRSIHFLKIDVEGSEHDVLLGMDFSRWRPWLVLIEVIDPITGAENIQCSDHMVRSGYFPAYFDGLNRFFLAQEHSPLADRLGKPPNVFDQFVRSSEVQAREELASTNNSLAEIRSQVLQAESLLHEREKELSATRAEGMRAFEELLTRFVDREDDIASRFFDGQKEIARLSEVFVERERELHRASEDTRATNEALRLELYGQALAYREYIERARADADRNVQEIQAEAKVRLEESSAREMELSVQLQNVRNCSARLAEEQAAELLRLNEALRSQESEFSARVQKVLEQAGDKAKMSADIVRRLEGQIAEQASEFRARESALAERSNSREQVHVEAFLALEARLHAQEAEYVENVAELLADIERERSAHANERQQWHDQLTAKRVELEAEIARFSGDTARRDLEQAELEKQLRERITSRELELGRVYASKSWALTHPLRLGNMWAVTGARVLRQAVSGAFNFPRMVVRDALVVALKRLRQNPHVHAKLYRQMQRSPLLLAHARAFARNRSEVVRSEVRVPDFDDRAEGTSSSPRFLNDERDFVRATNLSVTPRELRRVLVYVDHTVQCPVNTGVQRVVRQLVRALREIGTSVVLVKWNPVDANFVVANDEDLKRLSNWNGPAHDHLDSGFAKDGVGNPVRWKNLQSSGCGWLVVPEVPHMNFHGRSLTLDVIVAAKSLDLRTAFIFYDAIPLRRPELASSVPAHKEYMRHLLLADLIWPISQWSGKDLISYWASIELADANTMPNVEFLPLPGQVQGIERVVVDSRKSSNLILSVGTIEPRKNQVALIRAFQEISRRRPDLRWRLVLVGNIHPLVSEEVRCACDSGLAIQHLGHVSDRELTDLYQGCAFTVFPSTEEGFGLPILESLWFGKACVCADFGAMEEVSREGGCLMVDTRNVELLSRKLEELMENPGLVCDLEAKAKSRHLGTWNEYARSVSASMIRESCAAKQIGHVYYWVDHTIEFYKNTGIQRVTRQLARGLLENGARLFAVKWDVARSKFVPPTYDELEYLSRWNGPAVDQWSDWIEPSLDRAGAWFVMPELPLNRTRSQRADVMRFARSVGMHTAAVFYDAIPWKMRQIYPQHFSLAHKEYMEDLNEFDVVLPISEFSREDLAAFLGARLPKVTGLDERIRTVFLAGEFVESTRVASSPEKRRGGVTILCVGTVEPRKNHLVLVDAFERVQDEVGEHVRLIIVGRSTEPALAQALREHARKNPRIQWNEDADDLALARFYEACDFTVFPSVEEGFGLPILESLWYGKPCVCADFGAMGEVAAGGGCLAVNVRDPRALAEAIARLVNDSRQIEELTRQALQRPFKSWQNYAEEVAQMLAKQFPRIRQRDYSVSPNYDRMLGMGLIKNVGPLLSVCITTYNRADWLKKSLENWARLYPDSNSSVELLVCDNASTDHTAEVVKPFLDRPDFSYRRNISNVGMLGNLRETAQLAKGRFVWIVGDDDILMPGSVEKILAVVNEHTNLALIYLNYGFTRLEDARQICDFEVFIREATPIVPAEPDRMGPIKSICAVNENFFTAIYTLVFRRDHAMRAYSQNTEGRPFSSMLTAIPTTHYVLHNMMEELGYWVGTPQVVVNMNVSWMKYAPLWILERVPEVYDTAEMNGGSGVEIDRWRRHTLASVEHYFGEIYREDPEANAKYFNPRRLVWRFKHLAEFRPVAKRLEAVYREAHARQHPAARSSPSNVFPACISE